MRKEIKMGVQTLYFRDCTRETLYKRFFDDVTTNIEVEDIDNESKSEEPSIRYKAEKLLLLNFMMDPDLNNQIQLRKNGKYDYLAGLLLYISSNRTFGYGFGYFKERIDAFDGILKGWSSFLDSIVNDISSLPEISLKQSVVIQLADIIEITAQYDSILKLSIDLNRIERLFFKWTGKYNFNLRLNTQYGSSHILESGESDGSGKDGGLFEAVKHINNLSEKGEIHRIMLSTLIHGC